MIVIVGIVAVVVVAIAVLVVTSSDLFVVLKPELSRLSDESVPSCSEVSCVPLL